MNLATAFAASARKNSAKTAMFWGEQSFTYDWLRERAERVAANLTGVLGVRAGERVGLWLKNCPEFVPALFGILQAGAVVVPINNFLKPDEVAHILADAGIEVLITDAAMTEGLAKLTAARPRLQALLVDALEAPAAGRAAAPGPGVRLQRDDLAVIIYTSGTTGRPKGAMLTHGNLLHNVESCRQVLSAVEHDRFVVLLPMFHSFMLTVGVLLPTLLGRWSDLISTIDPPTRDRKSVV